MYNLCCQAEGKSECALHRKLHISYHIIVDECSHSPPFGTSEPGGVNGPPLTQVPASAISLARFRWPSRYGPLFYIREHADKMIRKINHKKQNTLAVEVHVLPSRVHQECIRSSEDSALAVLSKDWSSEQTFV